MENTNSQVPEADSAVDAAPKPRAVEVARVLFWLRQAWEGFGMQPGLWLGMTTLLLLMVFGLMSVPLLGGFAVILLLPILMSGFLYAAKRQNEDTGVFELTDLFIGFRQNTRLLLGFSLWLIVLAILIALLNMTFIGANLLSAFFFGSNGQPVVALGLGLSALMLAGVFNFVLTLLVFMAVYFALPLIFFRGLSPLQAMRLSWRACAKNGLSMAIVWFMTYAAAFFAALPLGLGFLILIPLFWGVLYAAYQDVFCDC